MAVIKVKKIPKESGEAESADDIIARFCFLFPQYTFKQASDLPYKRVRQMLRAAKREQLKERIDLAMIIAAPHAKGGKGVKNVINSLKEQLRK